MHTLSEKKLITIRSTIKAELPDSDFEHRQDSLGNLLIIILIGQFYVINFYIGRRFIPNIEISFDICIRSVRDRGTRSK